MEREMSTAKKLRTSNELCRRVKALRKALGMSQTAFSEELRVSPTQVSEWESGTEEPAVKKLIEMAELAQKAADKAYFFLKTGITQRSLRSAFPAALGLDNANVGASEKVPIVARFSIGNDGELLPASDRSLFLPVEQFGSAPFIHAFEVAEPLAGVLSAGDIAIVDRSPVDPHRLLNSIVAVFFERRHEYEGVSLSAKEFSRLHRKAKRITQRDLKRDKEMRRSVFGPEAFAAQEAASEAAFQRASEKTEEFMARPEICFGWLRLQPAGDQWDGTFEKQLSRVVLELSPPSEPVRVGRSTPLTSWLVDIEPLGSSFAGYIKAPIHVLGPVVGWFKRSARPTLKRENREV